MKRSEKRKIVEILRDHQEPLPKFLRDHRFDREIFFGSKTVFYPGSGDDGHPVSLCNRAHFAHAYIYADYGIKYEELLQKLLNGFLGYTVDYQQQLKESDLTPRGWTSHYDGVSKPLVEKNFEPYALYVIFKREEDFDDSHGAERFAILFIGGDGHATYDALYCQNDNTPPPSLVVIQDHGFGGNYSRFGAGGILEQLAQKSGVYPKWLLLGKNGALESSWQNYEDTGGLPECGGMHGNPRYLYLYNDDAC